MLPDFAPMSVGAPGTALRPRAVTAQPSRAGEVPGLTAGWGKALPSPGKKGSHEQEPGGDHLSLLLAATFGSGLMLQRAGENANKALPTAPQTLFFCLGENALSF